MLFLSPFGNCRFCVKKYKKPERKKMHPGLSGKNQLQPPQVLFQGIEPVNNTCNSSSDSGLIRVYSAPLPCVPFDAPIYRVRPGIPR